MTEKEKWLYEYFISRGMTSHEAMVYIQNNRRISFEGAVRKWREQAPDTQKNRRAQKDYRLKYSKSN